MPKMGKLYRENYGDYIPKSRNRYTGYSKLSKIDLLVQTTYTSLPLEDAKKMTRKQLIEYLEKH